MYVILLSREVVLSKLLGGAEDEMAGEAAGGFATSKPIVAKGIEAVILMRRILSSKGGFSLSNFFCKLKKKNHK